MDTTVFSQVNWLAVLVAALAYFSLGALWFSKALFANKWIHHHNINPADPEMKKGTGAIMMACFILTFITTIALAVLIQKLQLNQAISGIKLGLLTGVSFAAIAISITYLFLRKSLALHFIDGLYHVAGHIIAAVILCIWK